MTLRATKLEPRTLRARTVASTLRSILCQGQWGPPRVVGAGASAQGRQEQGQCERRALLITGAVILASKHLKKGVNMRSRVVEVRHDPRGSERSGQVVDRGHATSTGPLEPERWAIATHRVNVFIQGTSPFLTDTLAVLRRNLHHREFIWPDRPIAEHTRAATLLIQEIGELSPHALDSLARLIADNPRVQVIVTSSVVLYELVERGQFPADLYYRLNIVMLTDDGGALPRQACSS